MNEIIYKGNKIDINDRKAIKAVREFTLLAFGIESGLKLAMDYVDALRGASDQKKKEQRRRRMQGCLKLLLLAPLENRVVLARTMRDSLDVNIVDNFLWDADLKAQLDRWK